MYLGYSALVVFLGDAKNEQHELWRSSISYYLILTTFGNNQSFSPVNVFDRWVSISFDTVFVNPSISISLLACWFCVEVFPITRFIVNSFLVVSIINSKV